MNYWILCFRNDDGLAHQVEAAGAMIDVLQTRLGSFLSNEMTRLRSMEQRRKMNFRIIASGQVFGGVLLYNRAA